MNKFITISFVFLYSLALIQPYLPFINYAVNQKFIASILCENKNKPEMHCNGKCHLNKELKKAASENPKDNSSTRVNLEDFITLQTSVLYSPVFYVTSVTEIIQPDNNAYQHGVSNSIFHPPTA